MSANKRSLQFGTAALALAACVLLAVPASAQDAAGARFIGGIWGGAQVPTSVSAAACFNEAANLGDGRINERTDVYGRSGGERWIAFEQDCGIRNRGRLNKPMYKPEYWERIRLLDYNANVGNEWDAYADPVWHNVGYGVPRIGPPDKIIYVVDSVRGAEATFLWARGNIFKTFAADCRAHDPVLSYDQAIMGHAVGCWEGDSTLVVTSKGFSDVTWLHWAGWPHSNEMEVVERFSLIEDGNKMLYEVTVSDPVMFLEDWVMDPVIRTRNTNPEAILIEDVPYIEHSLGALGLPRNRG